MSISTQSMATDHTSDSSAIGVVLLNLGGPERLEDVEPFLINLFSDRQIIRLGPWFLQKPIARWIAKRRAPKSSQAYRLIGGGSPLLRITTEQGRALEKVLAQNGSFRVFTAMRYWHPFALETLRELHNAGIRRVVALSLYPHYSIATSGSSIDDLKKEASSFPDIEIVEIPSWPDQPSYVECLAENILSGIDEFHGEDVQVVYSAHSLPVKFIENGDPYLKHLDKTITAIEEKTDKKGKLCFQSRSGPVKWLSPSTPEMLEQLAGAGCRRVLMVPISFVSDHVETLYEIDIQYRELAESLGMELKRARSLNVQPAFIRCLKELVLDACCKMMNDE
jgi:ferrochelatase